LRRTVATWGSVLGSTVLLAGALAGCTGGEPDDPATASPTASPEGSPSPTTEPSPDVTKPERPAAMDNDDADGAAAAAVYFMEQWEYIMKSGDTAEWEAMSGNRCGTCETALQDAQVIADEGYGYEGGEKSVRVIEQYAKDVPTGIWPVDVETTTTPIEITDDDGEVVAEFDHEVSESRIEVGMGDEDWIIVAIAPIPHEGS
jgi:hypothetical protein